MNVVPRTVLVRPADPLGDLGRRAVHAQRVGDGAEACDVACGALSKKIIQFHSPAILNPFSMVDGGSPMFQLDISNCLDQHPITIPVCTDLDVDSPLDTLLIPNHVSVWINSTRVADHLSSLHV